MAEVTLRGVETYPNGFKAGARCRSEYSRRWVYGVCWAVHCAKSTTLVWSGILKRPGEGDVYIGDKREWALPLKDRGISWCFKQNYALYPHMSVYDNMVGLKQQKLPKHEINERIEDAAKTLISNTC